MHADDLETCPTAPLDRPEADPLAMPGVVRLALSERASRALSAAGECFAIIGRGTYPTDPARMVIYCQSVPLATAAAACRILTGEARAVRIMPPKAGKADPPATVPDRHPEATAGNVSATAAAPFRQSTQQTTNRA